MKRMLTGLTFFSVALFAADPVPQGTWGTAHIRLNVTAQGGHIEFDCAHAEIEEPLVLSSSGTFSASGTYYQEQGGPVRPGQELPHWPAVFSGTLSPDRTAMALTITLQGRARPAPVTLKYGVGGPIFKCL